MEKLRVFHSEKIIAIHQPNFFPWLGYFHKILNSDVFVFLDHVESNPDQSWMKRVQILVSGKPYWLSLPVSSEKVRDQKFPAINQLTINSSHPSLKKHLKSIRQSYGKAIFFKDVYPIIEKFYLEHEDNLAEQNIQWIIGLCQLLDIESEWIRSSSLNCKESSTDLLIEIAHKTNGSAYLCGGGAQGYQEDAKFEQNKVELIYQNFTHPQYQQLDKDSFIPGLSIVDALMHLGFKGTKELLMQIPSVVRQ